MLQLSCLPLVCLLIVSVYIYSNSTAALARFEPNWLESNVSAKPSYPHSAEASKSMRRSAGCEILGGQDPVHVGAQITFYCRCQSELNSTAMWTLNGVIVDDQSPNVEVTQTPTVSRITIRNISNEQKIPLCCRRESSPVCHSVEVVDAPVVTMSTLKCEDVETANGTQSTASMAVVCSAQFYHRNATNEGFMHLLLNNNPTYFYDINPTVSKGTDPFGKTVWSVTLKLSWRIPKNKQVTLQCCWAHSDGSVYSSEPRIFSCPLLTQIRTVVTPTNLSTSYKGDGSHKSWIIPVAVGLFVSVAIVIVFIIYKKKTKESDQPVKQTAIERPIPPETEGCEAIEKRGSTDDLAGNATPSLFSGRLQAESAKETDVYSYDTGTTRDKSLSTKSQEEMMQIVTENFNEAKEERKLILQAITQDKDARAVDSVK